MKMSLATLVSLLFAATGGVLIAGYMLLFTRRDMDLTWLVTIGWACLPSFVLAVLALGFQRSRGSSLVICIGGGIATVLSIGFYLQSLAVPDPQAGLAFLVCPVVQLLSFGVCLVIALATRAGRRSQGSA
jgi:hypothetical protein